MDLQSMTSNMVKQKLKLKTFSPCATIQVSHTYSHACCCAPIVKMIGSTAIDRWLRVIANRIIWLKCEEYAWKKKGWILNQHNIQDVCLIMFYKDHASQRLAKLCQKWSHWHGDRTTKLAYKIKTETILKNNKIKEDWDHVIRINKLTCLNQSLH